MELRDPLHEFLQLAEGIVQHRERFEPATDTRIFNVVASEYSVYVLVQPLLKRIVRDAPGVSLRLQRTTRGEPEPQHGSR